MTLTFNYAARSDVGLVRSQNQDSAFAGHRLLVVADGMGGHAGGDRASAAVIAALRDLDDDSPAAGAAGEALVRQLAVANLSIHQIVTSEPSLAGMGTTATAILRSRNKIALAHIGDSRAYLLRGDSFTQITRDHSLVQSLLDEGEITPDEVSTHPQRSVVTRVLTGALQDEPDLTVRQAQLGDRYLLCSDGISGFVARETLEEQLRLNQPPGRTAEALVDLALRAGAPDNATVVIADVVDATAGATPNAPQTVGAASEHPTARTVSASPAAKAAALTRGASSSEQPQPPLQLAEEPNRRTRWLRALGAVLALAVVLGALFWGARVWASTQYFIGTTGGRVALYQGTNTTVGPFGLRRVLETTDISLNDLPDFYRQSVQDTFAVDNRTIADTRIGELGLIATQCRAALRQGKACGAGVTTRPATPSPRTSDPSPKTSTASPSTRPTPSKR